MSFPVTVRVLLADDHELVRAGIRALLERMSGVMVVGEAQDGHEALQAIENTHPDIVLADIAMPGLNGLTLARRISTEMEGVRVIILSVHQSDAHVSQALQAGAAGYLVKGASLAELEL